PILPLPPPSTLFPYTTLFRSIFEIVHTLAPRVVGRRLSAARARLVAVALLALLVVGATIGAGAAAVSEVRSEGGGLSALLQKMADRKSTRLNSSHRTISYAVF